MRPLASQIAGLVAAAIVVAVPYALFAADDVETAGAEVMTPLQRIEATPKGELKNPYTDYEAVAEQGHKKYLSASCNGCHGGGGGGGICPPLTNTVWVYGRGYAVSAHRPGLRRIAEAGLYAGAA